MIQNLFTATTALLGILSLSMGLFSICRKPRPRVIWLWFFSNIAVTIWAIGYIFAILADSETDALFYLRIVYFGASLIPIFFFHFITTFLYKEIAYKYLLSVGYILAFIFLILNTLTNLVIRGSVFLENFGRYEEIATLGFYLFLFYFFFFIFFSICLLLVEYKNSAGIRRKQVFYILIAALIGFAGGGSNFLMALTGIFPYGQLFVWLYPLLITYGIFIDEIKIKIKF